MACLALCFLSGCVLINSGSYPPPVHMAAIPAGTHGGNAVLWASLVFMMLLAGLAACAFRRLFGRGCSSEDLDREDLALLRTARDALMLFNRKKHKPGLRVCKRPRDRL